MATPKVIPGDDPMIYDCSPHVDEFEFTTHVEIAPVIVSYKSIECPIRGKFLVTKTLDFRRYVYIP
jgi:hypothetical protein